MTVNLFTVDFENNKLFDYGSKGFDFIAVSGGTLETTTASKYEGNYGCEISPLQNYRCAGAKRTGYLTRFRQAFYLHPHAISIPTGGYTRVCRNYHNDASMVIYSLDLNYDVGPGYSISASCDINSTPSAWGSSDYVLDNQNSWNLIETDWYANDASGFFKLWINGTLKWNRTLVNGELRMMYPCLGAFTGNYTITGSFYIDYWRGNNDGSLIGA